MTKTRLTPITPAEVTTPAFPDSWLDVFNQSIQRNWDTSYQRSIVRLSDVVPIHHGLEILDPESVKPVYEQAGWKVHAHFYDDPKATWWTFLPPRRN